MTVSIFCPFILISVFMPLVLFFISLVFSASISMQQAVEALSRRSTNFASSSSSPAKQSTSAAERRLMIAALVALSQRFFMTRMRLVLMYFFVVAHKATCQALSKAFLKSMKTWKRSCWCWGYFLQRMRGLKICSEACLFFGDDLLSKIVQRKMPHRRVTDTEPMDRILL